MTRRALSGHVAAGMAVAIISISMAAGIAIAQTPGSSKSLPRTPWGDHDLQGLWSNQTATPLERPDALADAATLSPEEAEEREEAARLSADRPADEPRRTMVPATLVERETTRPATASH